MMEGPEQKTTERCWRSVGITGDRSCPELPAFIHCRNCPRYAEEGLDLFKRTPPLEYLQQWTETLGRDEERTAGAKGQKAGCVFRVGGQWLALSAARVVRVNRCLPVRRIPHRSNRYLRGLVNVDGVLRLCVSMHALLDLEETPPEEKDQSSGKARMVMVERDGENWVFVADEVAGLTRYTPEDVRNTPVTATETRAPLTCGVLSWNELVVGLIDEAELWAAMRRSLR